MRLPQHDGQNPLPLHENATRISCPQPSAAESGEAARHDATGEKLPKLPLDEGGHALAAAACPRLLEEGLKLLAEHAMEDAVLGAPAHVRAQSAIAAAPQHGRESLPIRPDPLLPDHFPALIHDADLAIHLVYIDAYTFHGWPPSPCGFDRAFRLWSFPATTLEWGPAASSHLSPWFSLVKWAVVALFVYFTMVLRGLLFEELSGSTRRSRAFRQRFG
jgi:hypothetical protein